MTEDASNPRPTEKAPRFERARDASDPRRAVLKLLRDEEWAAWSDREIAKRCRVGHAFVSKLRSEAPPTVHRGQIEPTRTARRGESVYPMRTENIGRRDLDPDEGEPVTTRREIAEIARAIARGSSGSGSRCDPDTRDRAHALPTRRDG